ncbi:hypothetical protein LPJ61_003753 [Coemansia biformis]|uniref:HECT-type E3 ubiquitin transferase n=1 Tax=Coemansia biformis TaxID=1286918 RepID=A0A9W7Y615_9FUNG|nr:hypothetical protein LPJ61_003753 [Coemansia biformis]
MTRSIEPSRKRQRVERHRHPEASTSGRAMVTRSRSQSTAQQQQQQPVATVAAITTTGGYEDACGPGCSGGVGKESGVDTESAQGDIVLTSSYIDALESSQEVADKLGVVFSDPCLLARSFPQKDDAQAAECPVDAADVRRAYALIADRGSDKVLADLRALTISAVTAMNADPCDEHDSQMNAAIILLLNPKITEYAQDDGTPVFPELCSAILNQPAAQRAALMRYFAADHVGANGDVDGGSGSVHSGAAPTSPAHAAANEPLLLNSGARRSFERYVGIFQSYITQSMEAAVRRVPPSRGPSDPPPPPPPPKVSLHALGSSSLGLAAQCLALMNSHNNTHRIAPYAVFYNSSVNEHIDIKDDVPRFRIPDGVSFCSYPFLLSPTTKSEIIRIESVLHMRTELQDSFFRAMFSGVTCPYLVLEVRRDSLVRDTLYQLDLKLSQDLRKQLKVRFVGEEGVDEGGVQKEFFQLIVRDVFSAKYGIFRASDNSRYHWFWPQAHPSQDALEEIRLTGQLIGLAVYNAVILDIHLPPALYKKLLRVPVTRDDLREVDPELYHGLTQLLRLSATELEALERTFEVEYDSLGELCTHELIPDGAQTLVTVDNRELFIDRYVDYVFNASCERQFAEFKSGFDRICGASYVRFMRPQELELLVCGCSDLDFGALERSTIYDGGYTRSSAVIRHFWEVVAGFTDELKRKLLFFATSSDRVPIGGLSKLHFVIAKNGGDSDRLPTSHTCFNVLLLPEYATMEKLRERLLTAIHNSEGFGMI